MYYLLKITLYFIILEFQNIGRQYLFVIMSRITQFIAINLKIWQ